MLYWFFVKVLGPWARHRFSPKAFGVDNIPRQGGGIIAANHLSVIDDGVIPLTSPRMVHYMGKSDYFTGKGIKGAFKKWWFTSVGVFPVDRAGGAAAEGAMNTARDIIEQGHLFGIHPEGTRSPDGRLYKAHTGAARLALETGCPVIPTGLFGTDKIMKIGQTIPSKGTCTVIYGELVYPPQHQEGTGLTRREVRDFADKISRAIQQITGQEYVDEYAQVVKKQMAAEAAQKAADQAKKDASAAKAEASAEPEL